MDDRDDDLRAGIVSGVSAYALWGVFPLVFHQLHDVQSLEIVSHRVIWSLVVVAAVLFVRGDRSWPREVLADKAQLWRMSAAGVFVATNWLVYIWAVTHDHVVEAALGYYINPLLTVALGVFVLDEHLRRAQLVALGFGAAAVVVLTIAYGRLPWIALVLATTFATYSFVKKQVRVGALRSLAVETATLAPIALVGAVLYQSSGDAAFGHGSHWRDLLMVSLGIVTAVPLLLFGGAASRIPLALLGLLQYLTPTLQLACGVLILDEDLPPERLAGFVLVWIALVILATDALRATRQRVPVLQNALLEADL